MTQAATRFNPDKIKMDDLANPAGRQMKAEMRPCFDMLNERGNLLISRITLFA